MGLDGRKGHFKSSSGNSRWSLSSIEEKKSAKEIWDHLARLYEARSLHNKKFLKRKLYALRMTESTSVTGHVNNMDTLFSQLISLSFFDDVAAAILEEENRRNNREDMQTSSRQVEALVVTKGRNFKKDCRVLNTFNPQENVASTSEDGNALCCKAAVANEGKKRFVDAWLFDTGTIFHMTIIKIGSIMVKMHDGTVRTIREVEIQNKIMKIIKGALVLMIEEKVAANLYQQKGEIIKEAETSVSSLSPTLCFKQATSPKFKTSNSRSVLVLELVHYDVWRCWVYPIKKKSDVFEVFNDYKARVELDSGKKIKFELKTSMEMWTGKTVNYFDLHIFGSPVYVMYNTQETTKLDLKSKKCLFLGYADGVKGYRLWDPIAYKHEINETNESQAPATRTLSRERKCPGWHLDYIMERNVAYCLLTKEGEPLTLQEALNNPNASFWNEIMQEEIKALHKNKTWELMPLLGGRKPIGSKWVYEIKKNDEDQVERYRKRLVVKGYAHKQGIDFNETFSLWFE
ncbi:retrovirus-related pol polyprotein from transposon TNT 1-94 [Tanacetum coccineum]